MSKGMPANDVETTKPTADNAVIIIGGATDEPPQYVDKEKEKRFSLFKAAMFMLRGRKEKEAKKSLTKKKSSNALSNAKWKKLVGSMRPMHLQETTQSPSSSPPPPQVELPPPTVAESVEEMIPTPVSPAPSSSGTMSQYASATSLQDLVDSDDEEEEDPDQVFDAITGDDMIDVKAEEFIAQFYKQIQLQNTATPIHHHNNL